jgi:beta-1,2-mannobiose phosphorylase / 1,2-beta-oligomannan phosphorylase
MNRILLSLFLFGLIASIYSQNQPKLLFGDTSRRGTPFSKDPHVIKFQNRYLLYYSVPPFSDKSKTPNGWGIGIAESRNLYDWQPVGYITPGAVYEKKGLCAPCAIVKDNQVHLFYQTYGNREKDAICHAVSVDGVNFQRNKTNPIFRPTGDWNVGRAIDAEVVKYKDQYLLYFATRDSSFKIQMTSVAAAPANTKFNRNDWKQLTNKPILKPELSWEQTCVEGASVIEKNNKLYMFYAGAYNNKPQQVGVAVSLDGVKWERLSDKPFLANGKPGEWNSSESGHPHIFQDKDGTTFLFYQGNDNKGKTYYLSNVQIGWNEKGPYIIKK